MKKDPKKFQGHTYFRSGYVIRIITLDSRALLFSRALFREPATEGLGKTAT